MYNTLLVLHSLLRWVFVASLGGALGMTYWGLLRRKEFGKGNRWGLIIAASAGHLQLLVGMILYFYSPFVEYFWTDPAVRDSSVQFLFFAIIHVVGMMLGMMLMGIGTALSKQPTSHHQKFRVVAIYWTLALLLILAVVPWPFSPLAQRPLWRGW
ncbi:MAG: hypothetical protein IPM61_07520 [Chlorobi bacterium]|nr:MAG: hypothetical protein UZ07_CHB004003384 [Chlorobi bacterium OLB7]MBK8911165.1 hypothetical protein [Chlorobiota bacterium]MBX7216640.1 hypothetical protein [Candidatus Kapabacteria bacterium]